MRKDSVKAEAPGEPYYRPDGIESGLITTILRAAESVSSPQCPRPVGSVNIDPALPAGSNRDGIPDEFASFVGLVEQVRTLLAGDARLAAQSAHLPDAFHSGDSLRLLFRTLFPLPDGRLLHRFDLSGQLHPHAVAVGEDGKLWVCGRVP